MLLKVNICHLSLQNYSSVKLSIVLNTKILLKELNYLLKTTLNLKKEFISIEYEFKEARKDSPIYRGSHRSLKPAVTLFRCSSYKMGQNSSSLQQVTQVFTVPSFHYMLQVKKQKYIIQ